MSKEELKKKLWKLNMYAELLKNQDTESELSANTALSIGEDLQEMFVQLMQAVDNI